MSADSVEPGGPVSAVATPALVIDLDALERKIQTMADFARKHGMRLRPHAKTHKSGHTAALQRAAGAVGVCVQKLSEAEALAAAGVTDLYISNEVIDPAKLARVAALAQRGVPVFEHALFVKSQVISRGQSHAVVDAGHKSHAIDRGLPRVWGLYLEFANGGDEHGICGPAAMPCPNWVPPSGWCPATATRP